MNLTSLTPTQFNEVMSYMMTIVTEPEKALENPTDPFHKQVTEMFKSLPEPARILIWEMGAISPAQLMGLFMGFAIVVQCKTNREVSELEGMFNAESNSAR